MSGPPPIPPRPPGYEVQGPANPPLPPRPFFQQQQPQQYQQYQYGVPPPPPPSQPQAPLPQWGQPWTQYQGSYSAPPAPPPPPPSSVERGQPLAQWSALHYSDGAPTQLFEELMASIFSHLDTGRTGYITPEVLSNFLDLSTFTREANLWKSTLGGGNVMFAPEDIADAELKWACEAWPFDHRVAVRFPGRPQLPYGGMPLLSLRGFTDMMAVEHAADPERACRGLNAALRAYPTVFPHMPRPLPRNALLPQRPPQVQRRIDDVSRRSKVAAQEKLAANHARLAMKERGQQAALDLIPNVRYYYY